MVPELDVASVIGGRYRPVRLLGKGGMGAVYEVEHLHTGQRLALKLLTLQPGASIERFKREARAASGIESENVVRVTDADSAPELGGAPYLVMELLSGSNLEAVTGDRPASPENVIEWLRQVARALGKAHERGIIHRDLKPENLFLTQRENGAPLVKVLDFGIAKMVTDSTALTHSGQFLGTPLYMAPEQADSQGPSVSPKTDLFALGLTAFRLLTGRTYWNQGSLAQIIAQVLAGPMPPPSARGSGLGPEFDAWFLRACDRDPAKRFDSAYEQVEALAMTLGLQPQPRISDPVPKAMTASVNKTLASPTLQASASGVTISRSMSGRRRWVAGALASGLASLAILALLRLGASKSSSMPDAAALGQKERPVTSAAVQTAVADISARERPDVGAVPQSAAAEVPAAKALPPIATSLPAAVAGIAPGIRKRPAAGTAGQGKALDRGDAGIRLDPLESQH